MEMINPYYIDDKETFFDTCAEKVRAKLETLPNKKTFTTDEIFMFLTSELSTDSNFNTLYDSVKNEIEPQSDGFISELEQRIKKTLGI